MHTIFVNTSYEKFGLVKVDITATVKQIIVYGKTDSGYNVVPGYTSKSYPSPADRYL